MSLQRIALVRRDRARIALALGHSAIALVSTAPQFVFRPLEPAPKANVYSDWNKLFAAARLVSGPRVVEMDGRLNANQCTIPDGDYNFGPTADVAFVGTGFLDPNTLVRTQLNVGQVRFPDGTGQTCINRISGLFVNHTGTLNPAIELSADANHGVEFVLENSNVQSAAVNAPFFRSGGAGGGILILSFSSLLTGANPCFKSGNTAFTDLSLLGGSQVAANALSSDVGATMLVVITAGAGVVSLTQTACPGLAVSRASPTENITLQKGTATLVNGVSLALPATITASSRILATAKDNLASVALGRLCALTADRVVGAPGSFKVTAQTAAAATEVTDQSSFDWHIVG